MTNLPAETLLQIAAAHDRKAHFLAGEAREALKRGDRSGAESYAWEAVEHKREAESLREQCPPRKPYAKPTVTRQPFEHLVTLDCSANPNM